MNNSHRSRNFASGALVRRFSLFLFLAQSFAAFPLAEAAETAPAFRGPLKAGVLDGPPRNETSGLAASRRAKDILWTHDDSGGAPVLYAIDTSGKKRGALRLEGVKNEDWEDLDSFEKDGKAWLLVADTGDNDAERKTVRLHLVAEPAPERLAPDTEVSAAPAYTLRFRYEDGPRDCESVAVDPAGAAVYLLTKRDAPPRLYHLPLAGAVADARDKVATAKLVGPVPQLVGQTQVDGFIKQMVGKKFSWPTAMDIAADGRTAVVLTYGEVLVFARTGNASWSAAFQQTPTRLLFHGMPQAEAAAFSADSRSIYVASEKSPTLIRYDREESGGGVEGR